jgi:D-threo-aldose 1-dehydrogenase
VAGDDAGASLRESSERLGLAVDLALAEDEAAYPALDELRRDGAIKAIGAVSADWRQLDRLVRDVELDCVSAQWAVLAARPVRGAVAGQLPRAGSVGDRVRRTDAAGAAGGEVERPGGDSGAPHRRSVRALRRLPAAGRARLSQQASAVTSVLIAASTPAEIRADAALVRQPVPAQLWHDTDLVRLLS